ncbi:hypothetical protein [Rhodococcus opacus]|uniref:hypothetical protein n=1 Tax=Rhodococcus opacus TaxID=37919 RepID=UPI0024735F6C|nr:hypothetical protein [Rhodococcus opacus]MDH6293405.1 hypothetical protein [Rhodococcus opacus]
MAATAGRFGDRDPALIIDHLAATHVLVRWWSTKPLRQARHGTTGRGRFGA